MSRAIPLEISAKKSIFSDMARTATINDFFESVTVRGLSLLSRGSGAENTAVQAAVENCKWLLSSKGEASGLALSHQILQAYAEFSEDEKTEFFKVVTAEFAVDRAKVSAAAEKFLQSRSAEDANALNVASTSQYEILISRLNQRPSATLPIIHMRADLLRRLRENPELRPLDASFRDVLQAWFNRGFLGLRVIDWQTPAAILENVIKYEAVHGMKDWNDLGRRIKPKDRLIFGFFHANLEDEPLIFVEVALTKSTPDAIGPILSEDREPLEVRDADTAVFYSISNCQVGLRGVPLGNFLIKQVVEYLRAEYPQLEDFVTLSPIPKLGEWMRENLNSDDLPMDDLDQIRTLDVKGKTAQKLLSAAAKFLVEEKAKDGLPIDPVCRFHIGNGARLERLNWLAHDDEKGFKSSVTVMANYRYLVDDIEKNHEAFANEGSVAFAPEIKKLLQLKQ